LTTFCFCAMDDISFCKSIFSSPLIPLDEGES
jgi:hypothetical protein